jgi:hypothetical protein
VNSKDDFFQEFGLSTVHHRRKKYKLGGMDKRELSSCMYKIIMHLPK